MIKVGNLLVFTFLIVGCGMIVIAPKRGKNDLNENWMIYEASPSLYRKTFIRINAKEAGEWAKSRGEAVVAVVAPWCPHSLSALQDGSYQTLAAKYPVWFVSSNYDLKNLDRLTIHNFPSDTIFIIDHEKYGEAEGEKIKQFVHQLTGRPLDSVSSGVPQHLFYRDRKWEQSFADWHKLIDVD